MLRNRRDLHVEALEVRQLLSATPSPGWFQSLPKPAEMAVEASPATSKYVTIDWQGLSVETRRGEWLVRFSDEATSQMESVADAQQFLGDAPFPLHVDKGLGLPGMVMVTTSASAAEASAWLSTVPAIQSFDPNAIRRLHIEEPDDPGYEFDYALDNPGFFLDTFGPSVEDADMDVKEAWDITTGDASTIVAVMDTGVNYLHEDLAANMWVNPGEIPGNARDDDGNGFIDDIHGFDFGEGDADPMDEEGHGTAVAGTIGAVGNNGVGTVGVNWDVRIMALKIADESGGLSVAAIDLATNYATMMRLRGTNVVASNHSYGGPMASDTEAAAIDAHRAAGIVFVASAGNDATNNDRLPSFPANYVFDNVVSVAATDSRDLMASFSSFGVNTVDVGAPGVNIFTTMVEGGYGYIDGTSFSSPYTAGVAALVASHAPTATYKQIRQAIFDGADRIPSLNGKVFTGGRVNANKALLRIEELAPAVPEVSGNSVAISDGDLTPNAADNTDFGSLSAANGRKVNTFTLANNGGVPLQLSELLALKITGPNAADFQVSSIPDRVVNGAESTQFSITFDPISPGVKEALVTVDFATAGTYSFAIRGTGLAPAPAWQNPRDQFDVNNDGAVSGLDVLVTINEINRNGQHELPPLGPGTTPPPYYDVNGDGSISLLDTLKVVNFINSRPPAAITASETPVSETPSTSPATSLSARIEAADLLFSTTWQAASDDVASSFGQVGRSGGLRSRK